MKTLMTSTAAAAILGGFRMPIAFETKAGWKLDADGKIETRDGNPIWIGTDGSEKVVEGGTISRLNGEAKTHREAKEAAETRLKAFEGIDPEAARKAIDTVSKLDAKKLIDAGEVDKVREEISKTFTAQITEKETALAAANAKIDNMTMQNAFSSSKFIADRVAVPPEMFQATFRDRFKVEDGKLVPYGADGNKVWSRKRAGEVADFDEALEIIVDSYPHKDAILKAAGNSGSGNGGGGGGRGGSRTMKLAEFEALPANKQAEFAALAGKGELTIVD